MDYIATRKEIAYKTGIGLNTMSSYLNGYRFAKFRQDKGIKYNQEFIDTLIEFLWHKRQIKAIDRLKSFNPQYDTAEM